MELDVKLGSTESLVAEGKVHLAALIVPAVVSVAAIVFLIVAPAVSDLVSLLVVLCLVVAGWRTVDAIGTRRTTGLVLTDERLIASTGPFRAKTLDVAIWHVDRVLVKQGLIARLFGYGTLIVTARGLGNQRLSYRQVASPESLAKQIRTYMSAPRKQQT